ncbi:MAG: hypothetical protein WCT20_03040 [Candidatus Babeliales bacterium]
MKKIVLAVGILFVQTVSYCAQEKQATLPQDSSLVKEQQTTTPQVTFGPGVLLVCDGTKMETFDATQTSSEDATRGEKGKQNIVTIFTGLAGSCVHVSEIVAAQTDREKNQGILNLMGTIFTVAAQLIGSSHRVYSSEDDARLLIQMSANQGAAAITLRFFDVLALEKDPTVFISDNEILTKLFALETDEQRICLIQSIMDNEQRAYQFWHALAGTLQDYISYYIESTLNVFNQAIAYTHDAEEPCMGDTQGECEMRDWDECCEVVDGENVEVMVS